MKEIVNGHNPLQLIPEHIFAYNEKHHEHFAYNDLGLDLSGLNTADRALNDNHMSPDQKQEEKRQEEIWENISTNLSLQFGIPKNEIDRNDILRQFRKLSQERVDMLSDIQLWRKETTGT